jgi:hypothetical protein
MMSSLAIEETFDYKAVVQFQNPEAAPRHSSSDNLIP